MSLAGDVPVGLTWSISAQDLLLCPTPPEVLIYNVEELKPLSVFGTLKEDQDSTFTISPFYKPVVFRPPFTSAFFSAAPLSDAKFVTVFNHFETGFCMGILLEYKNGSRRSLGQCRLGLDNAVCYDGPSRGCLRQIETHVPLKKRIASGTSTLVKSTVVKFTRDAKHNHSEDGWTCFPMQGELEFWFSCEETDLIVVVD